MFSQAQSKDEYAEAEGELKHNLKKLRLRKYAKI